MGFEHWLSIGVIAMYFLGVCGVLFGALSSRQAVRRAGGACTLAGFGLHTLAVIALLHLHTLSRLTSSAYLQLLAWCLVALFVLAWRVWRLPLLSVTVAPLALALSVLSLRASDVPTLLPEHLSRLFFWLHVGSLFFSLALMALAFGAGLFFLLAERKLKTKSPLGGYFKDMPALATCDTINYRTILVGFPLHTLGLMSGFIWSPLMFTTMGNPKVVFSLVVWALYALLFYQRMALGYRGRKVAKLAILIFCLSALSFGIDYTMIHHSQRLLP